MPAREDLVRQRGRVLALTRGAAVVAALIVLAFLAAFAWLAFQTYEQSKANGNAAQLIADCTTPGGACYERTTARTGEAVGSINQITIAANYCSLRFDGQQLTEADFHTFTACVRAHVNLSR